MSLKRANERERDDAVRALIDVENNMERSQTLEAIFTSSASTDRLPSAPLRRISATLSLAHTFLLLHSIPARSRHCSSKYPNNMLFFQSLISMSLARWS